MKIITLSDGTQIHFPEVSDGYSQSQLDLVEKYITGFVYPVRSLKEGGGTTEYSSPDKLFSETKTFDGVPIQRVYR